MAKSKKHEVEDSSKAILRYIRLSPTKARLIAKQIQGMNAEEALARLEFTPNKAARFIYKTLASAIANGSYEASNTRVISCRVDRGPVLRRFMPRARGRATPIRKPMSHIFVEVGIAQKDSKKNEKLHTTESKKKIKGEVE